jgi:hypothetical protein
MEWVATFSGLRSQGDATMAQLDQDMLELLTGASG